MVDLTRRMVVYDHVSATVAYDGLSAEEAAGTLSELSVGPRDGRVEFVRDPDEETVVHALLYAGRGDAPELVATATGVDADEIVSLARKESEAWESRFCA